MPVRENSARCVWPAQAMLGEGPLWIEDERTLYWVDILKCRLHRYQPEPRSKETCQLPVPLTALVPARHGVLLGTSTQNLHVFDPRAKGLTRVDGLTIGTPRTRMNDGALHPDGSFWFGTMDLDEQTRIGDFYRLAADGTCERIETGFAITNGPAFSSDGRVGYFVDTVGKTIFRASIVDGRIAGTMEPFVRIPESDGYPDGVVVDADGGVWCAHFGGWRVTRFDADGVVTDIVRLPVANVTKCALAGDRMFITTARKGIEATALGAQPLAGGLFEAEVGRRGAPQTAYRGVLRMAAASSTCFFETS